MRLQPYVERFHDEKKKRARREDIWARKKKSPTIQKKTKKGKGVPFPAAYRFKSSDNHQVRVQLPPLSEKKMSEESGSKPLECVLRSGHD